jgi:hypothetical protein
MLWKDSRYQYVRSVRRDFRFLFGAARATRKCGGVLKTLPSSELATIEKVFSGRWVRRRMAANHLSIILAGFVQHLHARGYTRPVIHRYCQVVEHFGRWLKICARQDKLGKRARNFLKITFSVAIVLDRHRNMPSHAGQHSVIFLSFTQSATEPEY